MSIMKSGEATHKGSLPESAKQIVQAEYDYYDCMARFGHQSAEAHVAEIHWRRLRSRRARTSCEPL